MHTDLCDGLRSHAPEIGVQPKRFMKRMIIEDIEVMAMMV